MLFGTNLSVRISHLIHEVYRLVLRDSTLFDGMCQWFLCSDHSALS